MDARSTMLVDDTLIIFEGPARVDWTVGVDGKWTPTGIWPGPRHGEMLRQRLECRAPILVVLDEARLAIPVLREEWERAPEAVRAALTREGPPPAPGEEVMELRVPFLDWLPVELRATAETFLAETDLVLAHTPAVLLPPLLTGDEVDGVRFARRLLPGVLTQVRLTAAVRHLARSVSPYRAALTCSPSAVAG